MTKPWQQGRFDGLCGIYALINAVAYLHPGFAEGEAEALFVHLIEAGKDLFPGAVYEGIEFEPLCDLAESLPSFLGSSSDLRLTRPFVGEEVACVREYLADLEDLISGRPAVAIVGLGTPYDHWTVITDVHPTSLRLRDSYGIKKILRSTLCLGEDPGRTSVDYRETFVIERLVK